MSFAKDILSVVALSFIARSSRARPALAPPAYYHRQLQPWHDPQERSDAPPRERASDSSKRRGLWAIGKAVLARIGRDNLTLVAAGVAFYAMLAIFPALAAFISLYGLFADPATVQNQISTLSSVLPPEALSLLEQAMKGFAAKGRTQLNTAALVGFALALWSAKSGATSLITGLNIANDAEEKRSYVMQQVVALLLTLFGVVMAILALAAVAFVPALIKLVGLEETLRVALQWGRWPLLAIVIALAFAIIYRFGPCKPNPKWHWITIGSVCAMVMWLAGSAAFSFYVSHFGGYDKTYGSLAAVVILLLWLWVTALVVLIGAEVDAELTAGDGTSARPVPSKDARPVGRSTA